MNIIEYINYILTGEKTIFDNNDTTICSKKENLILEFSKELQNKFKLKIEKWTSDKDCYPNYMFLGGDRGILAYLKFNLIDDEDGMLCYDLSQTLKLISRADSELDRPVFVVNFIWTKTRKCLAFETNEEIKDRIYTDVNSYDVDNNVYIVNENYTGNADELIDKLIRLKKENVIMY